MRRWAPSGGPPKPPDFVGVGVYMGGGAWWRRLLRQHPEISRPPRRSKWTVNFFQRFHDAPWEAHNADNYLKVFAHKPGIKVGDWSDRYALHPWTAPLLAQVAPDVKLVYMVRDPVERFRRQAAFNFSGERAGFPVYMAEAIARGRYASQLHQLEQTFPRDRILVLQHEACRLDPLGEWQRTCRFLGVDPEFIPWGLESQEGTGMEEVRFARLKRLLGKRVPEPLELWPDIEATLVREYEEEVRRFAAMAPEVDVGLWPRFADGAQPRIASRREGLPKPSRRRRRDYVLGAGALGAAAAAVAVIVNGL